MFRVVHRLAHAALACACLAGLTRPVAAQENVSFARDVLPVLSDRCFHCHGPDENKRKAKLRLDVEAEAKRDRDGTHAIAPGKPEQSEVWLRIISQDEDELMPPPDSHRKALTSDEREVVRRWIKAGAPWGRHWSFEPPVKSPLPGKHQHPVDAFVRDKLASEGMRPSEPGSPHTLIRRIHFDLLGLPPAPETVARWEPRFTPPRFASSSRKAEHQRQVVSDLVAELLQSPHFGERMAMWWLDAARYADTDGFQQDAQRSNWPWRDWVVQAFNANMPFDQFTIEQFAGDLLPDATPEQRLATCFHRNHMTNGEGGRDPEESRVDYVIDRVNTMGTTWLGLTLGCAQCHSHKFDPVSQTDYYSLSAFFNSIDEDGKAGGGAKPFLAYQSPLAELAVKEAQGLVSARDPVERQARTDAEQPFATWLEQQAKAVRGGFKAWHVLHGTVESQEGTTLAQAADGIVQASGANPFQDDYRLMAPISLPRITGLKLEVFPHSSHTGGGLSRGKSGEFILTDIKVQVRQRGSTQVRDIAVKGAVADVEDQSKTGAREYGRVSGVLDDDPRNGWTTRGAPQNEPHTALFELEQPLVLARDEELIFQLLHRSTGGDANIGRFRVLATDQAGPAVRELRPAPLEELAGSVSGTPTSTQIDVKLRDRLMVQFLEDHAPFQTAKRALDRAKAQLAEAKSAAGKLNVMVLAERKKPRDTFVLVRGVWDKHGDKVTQDVPARIAPWPTGVNRDRLGLARWIVSKDNPLTARVAVNHFWQMLFGAGLVRTPEDFGLQGEPPTHPRLLDWLAVEFMESGWDVKHLLTLIITSETYQQSSAADAKSMDRDPENRLLARGSRFRLPSWMLRDAALQTSGLLNPALGGPPVRPYQPEGVWEELFMGRFTYLPSEGAAQYRRTLYAFWRRTIAPTYLFDTAQRRVCEVRTPRTNTPLQALTLLNDETFLEASRTLAAEALRARKGSRDRLQLLFQHVLSREGSSRELAVLQREVDKALAHYQSHADEAAAFLRVGQTSADASLDLPALAAHTLAASLLFNLDEAITHE